MKKIFARLISLLLIFVVLLSSASGCSLLKSIICGECGTKNAASTKFCFNCGDGLTSSINNSNDGGSIDSNNGGSSNWGNNYDNGPKLCNICKGTGEGRECIGCDGIGQALAYYDINDRAVYRTCYACKGRGYLSCAYCGGDGYR